MKYLIFLLAIILISCDNESSPFNSLRTASLSEYNYGFAATSNGEIYRTIDDGTSWEVVYSNDDLWIEEFTFINDSICFALDRDGVVLKTQDQGNSWLKLDIQIGDHPRVYQSENNIYLYSDDSYLYVSNQLMFNWQRLYTQDQWDIKAVYEDQNNYLWISASNRNTIIDTIFFNRDFSEYWFPSTSSDDDINFITGRNDILCAGGGTRIIYSRTEGQSWDTTWQLEVIEIDSTKQYSERNIFISQFDKYDQTIVVGGTYLGKNVSALLSKNHGQSWEEIQYTQESIPFGSVISNIDVNSNFEFVISGSRFNIIRTENGALSWEVIQVDGEGN